MEEFQNRYGINTLIYEFCRYKNLKIPEKFFEDKLDPLFHMPILEQMLQKLVRKLEDYYTISRNEKAFPEILSNSNLSVSYWTF